MKCFYGIHNPNKFGLFIFILLFIFFVVVNGVDGQSDAVVTNGPLATSSKRTSWMSSFFGSSKPSSSSNSSQESEEISETDGTKKDEQAKKEEHTFPGKGK